MVRLVELVAVVWFLGTASFLILTAVRGFAVKAPTDVALDAVHAVSWPFFLLTRRGRRFTWRQLDL